MIDWETMPDDEVIKHVRVMLRTWGSKDDYKWFCKRLGLPVSGTKAILEQRLVRLLESYEIRSG